MDNHPLLRPDQPLEILRTIHSFDPCMACGVHVLDADGQLGRGGQGPMTAPALRGIGPAPPPMADRRCSPRARFAPPSGDYRWVYLWGVPLRAMHWIAALSILVLIVTGLYIGNPYFVTAGDAAPST